VNSLRAWARLALLCVASACTTSGPTGPEPSSVNVGFRWLTSFEDFKGDGGVPSTETDGGPLPEDASVMEEDSGTTVVEDGGVGAVTVPSPLRYALAWLVQDSPDAGPGHWITTAGGPIPDLQQGVLVDLVMPAAEQRRLLSPTETAYLRGKDTTSSSPGHPIVVARPRIVIYEDVDEDGAFCPASAGCAGRDRVLGVAYQNSEILAVLDLDATLRSLSVGSAQDFYAASGGRFTPFVAARSETPSQLTVWSTHVSFLLDGWSYPDLPVQCARIGATSSTVHRFDHVDVQAIGVACSVDGLFDCEIVALHDLAPPQLDFQRSTRLRRQARCQARGDWQRLTVTEQTPVGVVAVSGTNPGICVGRIDVSEANYVAASNALPPWWPCGTQIPLQN
jgi:hypothetical protein